MVASEVVVLCREGGVYVFDRTTNMRGWLVETRVGGGGDVIQSRASRVLAGERRRFSVDLGATLHVEGRGAGEGKAALPPAIVRIIGSYHGAVFIRNFVQRAVH